MLNPTYSLTLFSSELFIGNYECCYGTVAFSKLLKFYVWGLLVCWLIDWLIDWWMCMISVVCLGCSIRRRRMELWSRRDYLLTPRAVKIRLRYFSVVFCIVARWRSGEGFRLATNRSQFRVPASPLHVMTLGKLFTHMWLCLPSRVSWYRRKLGVKQALHATHWPRVHGLAALAGVRLWGWVSE